MTTWHYIDIPRNRKIQLPTGNPAGLVRDIEWMGIRKGGDRWYALENQDGIGWAFVEYRPNTSTGQIVAHGIATPPTPGNFNPLGITNDKKGMVVSSRDQSGAQPDQLTFYDYQGNLLREAICSDAPDRDNSRLTFLEHDYYVAAQEGGDAPWRIKVYDSNAELIRKFTLFGLTTQDSIRGLTTDGKYLYVLVVRLSNHIFDRIVKVSVRGEQIASSWAVGDNQQYLNGVTFDGLYLITRLDEFIPPDPV